MIGLQFPAQPVNALMPDGTLSGVAYELGNTWMVLISYGFDHLQHEKDRLLEFQKNISEFNKLNCDLLAISSDSVFSHAAWRNASKEMQTISFPILSDNNLILSDQLNIVKPSGELSRAVVIIDPSGLIKYISIIDSESINEVSEILTILRKLQK